VHQGPGVSGAGAEVGAGGLIALSVQQRVQYLARAETHVYHDQHDGGVQAVRERWAGMSWWAFLSGAEPGMQQDALHHGPLHGVVGQQAVDEAVPCS
jgi:hypothetical protein